MSMLDAEHLTLNRGKARVLDDLSLTVAQGEVLAIGGPSGGGKTTLLRVLLGLILPDSGTVKLRGQLASINDQVLIQPEARKLAVVFQGLALWPHLTVGGNLAFGLAAHKVPRSDRKTRIHDTLTAVGLAEYVHRYPGQLSGGEQQRVAIARALVLEPDAVLFDEPLSNLDVALKHDLLELLKSLLQARDISAIYVTHDPREARFLANRLAIMEQGRIVQVGTVEALSQSPATEFVQRFMG